MLSGFTYPFKTPANFTARERAANGLPRDAKRLAHVHADDRASVIHLNSTYVDMIDRWYTIRGGIYTALLIFLMLPGILFGLSALTYATIISYGEIPLFLIMIGIAIIIIALIIVYVIVRFCLGREYFTYTHYPIRFNRKTRMIHVFRHNGPGGVLSVPWDAAYFHIGQGTHDKDILDLRGHVMDGDTVVDTFAVGNFFNAEKEILQIWKFLVIYMEQGPQALPKDIYILTSTSRSLVNQYIGAYTFCNIFFGIPGFRWIFIALTTPTRWLVMLSCRNPVWPPEIQAESAIEPNDPCIWGEPSVTGAPVKDSRAESKAMRTRRQRINKD